MPFQLHSLALSVFASFIAPFGGFFASGFKRAFKIKVGCCTVPFAAAARVLFCSAMTSVRVCVSVCVCVSV